MHCSDPASIASSPMGTNWYSIFLSSSTTCMQHYPSYTLSTPIREKSFCRDQLKFASPMQKHNGKLLTQSTKQQAIPIVAFTASGSTLLIQSTSNFSATEGAVSLPPCSQLHENLLQNYTHISASDIQEKYAKMKARIKINEPIKDLFE